ncbi:hypothetical protein PsorP6_006024 [Peronosclerospora sorghi]|uniref:Uncharacterized protein n=1 Tax=Peronosclerospora sorghi TaxID=230839 RepID=A0ACC0W5U4_9STRA|nr:hypothetical protein PsorP6_006024 [Peronosclerospora sorghi]
MDGLFVCDDAKRIRYLYTGWPGCSHDALLMQNCDLVQNKDRMFSVREYLLADSGFVPDVTIIPCFKKPAHGSLNTEQKIVNKQLSSFRVCNDHCIGLLKGLLHNLLLSEDFDWVDIDVDENGDEQDEKYHAGSVGDTPEKRERLWIMEFVLDFLNGLISDGVLQED